MNQRWNCEEGLTNTLLAMLPKCFSPSIAEKRSLFYFSTIFTSCAAAESNSTVGSSFPEEEEEEGHCLLNLGFYGICAMFNLTSKMRFTNNRLTDLQTDKTWLGLSRLSRVQQNYK